MTRTKLSTLAALALAGVIVFYVLEGILVRLGEPQFVPPITLGVALGFIGVILPILARPMKKLTRAPKKGERVEPVNPIYATRVLLLAKAGSLTGATLMGSGVGVGLFVATRSVFATGPFVLALVSAGGGLVLTVGGLLAERWCQLPPLPGPEATVPADGEPA